MMEACEGKVTGALAYARVKRSAPPARRSSVGVRCPVPPNAPTRSERSVSTVISNTLQPLHAPELMDGCVPRLQSNHAPTATTTTTINAKPAEPAEKRPRFWLLCALRALCVLSLGRATCFIWARRQGL